VRRYKMALQSFLVPQTAFPTSSGYSGLGQAWTGFSQNQVMPLLSRLVGSFGAYAEPYNQAGQMTAQYMTNQLLPSIQGVLNRLAGRGMLQSSVASDALAKTAATLGGQALGAQAGLLGSAAQNYGESLFKAAELGRYSTQSSQDPSAPYRVIADLLNSLL